MGQTASTENVTLCGDRACRVREMQARVRLVRCARNRLRRSCVSSAICPALGQPRSCVSSARNAGESAICPIPPQPSAEIVRVECAKCRRECDLSGVRLRRSCVVESPIEVAATGPRDSGVCWEQKRWSARTQSCAFSTKFGCVLGSSSPKSI